MSIDPLVLGMGHLGIMALKKTDIEPVKLQREEIVVTTMTSYIVPLPPEIKFNFAKASAYWKEKTNE